MSFNIERGLFKFDFLDHHAVLGIPVNADVKEVRKRYIKIARSLHPDTIKNASEAEKKLANQLLSKLVNPAYEQLFQNNRDYVVNLGHLGRRLAGEKSKVPLTSDAAQKLAKAGINLDNSYKSLVQNLATKQYDVLEKVLDNIAQISELNMVYLMLSGGKIGPGAVASGAKAPLGGTAKAPPTATPNNRPPTGNPGVGQPPNSKGGTLEDSGLSRATEYIRRAEGYMSKENYAGAVLELREALKLDPTSGRAHTLLGVSFLKQNQATMAKVHINKALQLNPKDELALRGKKHLDNLAQKNNGGKPPAQAKPEQTKPPEKQGGGLFGGLFGGKKK